MQHRINRSAVVALLEQWERELPAATRQDVAERLGAGLGALDAVRLDGALRAIEAHPATAGVGTVAGTVDLDRMQARYERGVQDLRALVAQHGAPPSGTSGSASRRAPVLVAEPPVFASEQKRYQLTQKQIAHTVAQLRAQLRQWLLGAQPALRQLAALDAVMEQTWGPWEDKRWAALRVFLERRWHHRSTEAGALPELGWRAFAQDVQALLWAETQVRLLPVEGLVEAARNAS